MSADIAPAELAALRATWERIRPPYGEAMTFEQAIAWPPLAIVIRMAARSGSRNGERPDVSHPTVRALANVYSLPAQRTRDHTPPRAKKKAAPPAPPKRPDAKQRQANDVDLFAEENA